MYQYILICTININMYPVIPYFHNIYTYIYIYIYIYIYLLANRIFNIKNICLINVIMYKNYYIIKYIK